MDLEQAFADGSLMHPVRDEPSSVDLVRALAMLSGYRDFAERPEGAALRELIGPADHYVLVLVDGLGMNQRPRFPNGGFLERHLTRSLRSAFPSTTSVALTSLATGAWPAEHGVAGWWTRVPEYDRVIAPIPAKERYTDTPIEELGFSLSQLIEQPPLAPLMFRTSLAFYPRTIAFAPYAQWSRAGTAVRGFRTFGGARRRVRRALRRADGPTFSYLYIPTVDSLSHHHGIAAPVVTREIAKVDRLLGRLREQLSSRTRMIVTADHGLADVEQGAAFIWNHDDPLVSYLVCAPTAEQTLPVFHVADRQQHEFARRFAESEAGRVFSLVPTGEFLAGGVLGPVPVPPRTASRYGDFVGVSTTVGTLQVVPEGGEPLIHTAVHGGLRSAEVSIPLVLA